jgi:hypothetical protein
MFVIVFLLNLVKKKNNFFYSGHVYYVILCNIFNFYNFNFRYYLIIMTLLTTSSTRNSNNTLIDHPHQFVQFESANNNSDRKNIHGTNLNRIKYQFLDNNILPGRTAISINNNSLINTRTKPKVTAIINPKDLFKSPSQQHKISITSNNNNAVLTARSVYELKIKSLNNKNDFNLNKIKNTNNYVTPRSTKLFDITPPDENKRLNGIYSYLNLIFLNSG